MESLATLVATLLLGMLLSAAVAGILAWRGKTLGMKVVAMVIGMPGAYIGTMLFINAGSLGGRLFGAVGIAGCVYPAWRMVQAMRSEPLD